MARTRKKMPSPTEETINSPEFKAIWAHLRGWDISVPDYYPGYQGASGSHVQLILNALSNAGLKVVADDGKPKDDTKYVVVHSAQFEGMVRSVQAHLNSGEGWEPCGGITIADKVFYQALFIKPK